MLIVHNLSLAEGGVWVRDTAPWRKLGILCACAIRERVVSFAAGETEKVMAVRKCIADVFVILLSLWIYYDSKGAGFLDL